MNNNKKTLKALVVDDEEIVRDFLRRFLNLKDIEVKTAEDGYKAIEAVQREEFDIVFVEVRMPGIDGLQTFTELKKINPHIRYVMMSADDTDSRLEEAKKEGADWCFKKPFDIEELKLLIDKVRASPE